MKYKFFLIIIIGVLIDQLTKFIFQYKNITLIPKILLIKYSTNPGIIFGLFPYNKIVTILIPLVIIAILAIYCFKEKKKLVEIGTALVITGLLGNLIDRIIRGYVIDFIFIPVYPAYSISLFNIADSLLISGVILLIYYNLK